MLSGMSVVREVVETLVYVAFSHQGAMLTGPFLRIGHRDIMCSRLMSIPKREFLPSSNAVAPAPGVLPVLIVDDESDILAMLRDVLEDAGFAVLTARDGKAALALLEHTPVALVLTDLMMPRVTGLQMAEQMRSNPRTAALPVLVMSAALPPHMADVFAAALPKPFVLDDLVATLLKFSVGHTSEFQQSGIE